MEKVSIIIPVYNSEQYIKKSIISLINQTYENIEFIIVNDGSTDQSENIIKDFSDPRIKYFKNTNHGVSYSRNFGISKATGDYLMFVDSDDVISEKMVEILMNNLKSYDADLSVCNYKLITQQEIEKDNDLSVFIYNDSKYICLFNVYKGFLCNKLYKREIIVNNNIVLNEGITMCEDMLFNFEYLEHVNKVVYSKARLYGYLMHNDNTSKKINEKWFSILSAYNNLFYKIENYDLHTQNVIVLNFLYTLFEARVRCNILKISFEILSQKYNVDFKKIESIYYGRIMKDKCINFKEKIKLIMFYKFYLIAKIIKENRLLKGC